MCRTSLAGSVRLVTFAVGPADVTYQVHDNVVSGLLRYDPAALTIRVNSSPETFDIFLRWAYTVFNRVENPSKMILEGLTGAQLLELYALGNHLQSSRLVDAVTTCIFFRAKGVYRNKKHTSWYGLGFTPKAFEAYENSLARGFANMHGLFSDLIVHDLAKPNNTTKPSNTDLQMLPDSLQDLHVHDIYKYRERWAKAPEVARCCYHHHSNNNSCQDGWGPVFG